MNENGPVKMLLYLLGGRLLDQYVRNNTTPAFQRFFFGAIAGAFVVVGAFFIVAGAGIGGISNDPTPGTGGGSGLLLGAGILLVVIGWLGIQINFRRIRNLETQEKLLLAHLSQAHNYNGYRLWEKDRQLHVWLHQATRSNHLHDWQQNLPGPIAGRTK